MRRRWQLAPLAAAGVAMVAVLAGCVTAPTGPRVMALPGSAKSFDQFQADDVSCRQFAQYSLGATDPTKAANDAAAANAVTGAALRRSCRRHHRLRERAGRAGRRDRRGNRTAVRQRSRSECRWLHLRQCAAAIRLRRICSACTPRATRYRSVRGMARGRTAILLRARLSHRRPAEPVQRSKPASFRRQMPVEGIRRPMRRALAARALPLRCRRRRGPGQGSPCRVARHRHLRSAAVQRQPVLRNPARDLRVALRVGLPRARRRSSRR